MEIAWSPRSTEVCFSEILYDNIATTRVPLTAQFPSTSSTRTRDTNGRRHLDFRTPQHQKLTASSFDHGHTP